MSPPEFSLLFITVAVGALFQVSIGFGLGLLAAPVIAIFDPSLTPVVVLLLATGVTAAVLVLEGGHLDLRGAGWALAGRVPGAVGGAALVAVLPARQLALLVAVVVLAGVAVSLRGFVPAPRRRSVLLAGLMSGLMGTATSIGGPPMAMVWQRLSGPRLRATMSGFFLAGSVMSLAILAATGAVHTYSLWHTALLAPAAAIGVLLARPLSSRLDMRRTRGVAMVLAVASATVLVIQQFV
ncbi:sulfite exporter TauE/SafE family protein [Streptomyces sp. NPDC094472]|uniref:sulfite exporter TauE/SafE family protein n=1 Tax=Streptomyces sp. NPDC094472 TaxID=3155080 RepID=UPI00332E6F0E